VKNVKKHSSIVEGGMH